MIKLLHFADVHIGVENYGHTDPNTGLSTRVMDFLRCMDEMVNFAREHDADVAIFAGDAFKTRNPNPTFQREFAWRIQDLAALCPVVLLVGNHDLPINIKKASSVEIYETLNVPNVIVGRENRLHYIETKSGPIQVATVPYPVRARLLEDQMDLGKGSLLDLDRALQEYIELIIRDLGKAASEFDTPRVLTGHFTVNTAKVGSERQIMLGRDVAITLANIADPIWNYVALGHIHQFQDLTLGRDDLPPVVYSGSIERIDFGEEKEDKGFVWVELEAGQRATYQFIKVNSRPFVTIRCDVRRTSNPMHVVLEKLNQYDLNNAVVRVIITADPESNSMLQVPAIERAIREKGANLIASINRDVESLDRLRLGTNPEGLTPFELLERYLASKGASAGRIQELLEAAQKIFQQEQDN